MQTFPGGSLVSLSYTTTGNCTFSVDNCTLIFQVIPNNGTDHSVYLQSGESGAMTFTAYGGAYQFILWVSGYPKFPSVTATAVVTGSCSYPLL